MGKNAGNSEDGISLWVFDDAGWTKHNKSVQEGLYFKPNWDLSAQSSAV